MSIKKFLPNLDNENNRWIALFFIALGLAIVIIDNTVLNVAIPYIIADLHTNFTAIQWVVSGYTLLMATLLITAGRLGDMFGRKKMFLTGTVLFAIGSFIASISTSAAMLFFGEAFIEALGAALMLTSALATMAYEFRGKERAIAFGVWGSIAGASASVGPLLGGYLTTYFSWRYSFRINVFVALITILGSVFIKESKSHEGKRFDWLGTILSGVGLFSLIFALIEGRDLGWFWPSPIPLLFLLAAVCLTLFIFWERHLEKQERAPLLKLSLFAKPGFSFGLLTLTIVSLGQFGTFFILPLFLENVVGLNAFQTGVAFLSSSVSVFIFGPVSGFIASKINPKYLVNVGMFILALGVLVLSRSVSVSATAWSLAPSFILFGMGIGIASAQLNNIILSSVPIDVAGEASGSSATTRQVGSTISSALIGTILASSLLFNITTNINKDSRIPAMVKQKVLVSLQHASPESLQFSPVKGNNQTEYDALIKANVDQALVDASKRALSVAFIFVFLGALVSLLIPKLSFDQGRRPE
ncbi:MAG: DHA2 family efflux MFS transporter permease subunit [Patescibacteria group bacterium]|nr:DHA2 family efflux MFS transporter permease subunit [Patescibacteria group bacterium]